jgi:hypothetical protein
MSFDMLKVDMVDSVSEKFYTTAQNVLQNTSSMLPIVLTLQKNCSPLPPFLYGILVRHQ